jgi:hypothetical protein
MRIATGRVIDGKIVVEGDPFEDGTTVTVIAPDVESFDLVPEEEAELLESLREFRAGRWQEGFALLRDLARKT